MDTTRKTAYIRTRVQPQIKKDADRVFNRLGISTSEAISVFLRQVSLQNGMPFDLKIPNEVTRAALREDLSQAKQYTDVDTMFEDILGKNWRKKKI